MALRFVIADDLERPRMRAKQFLRQVGEVVGLAANGLEAVQLCEKLRPDVVILDVSMPILPGDIAAKQILAAGTARFVCMATSMRQDAVLVPLRAIGCHVVTKPFYRNDLLDEIAAITGETFDANPEPVSEAS